MAWTGDVIQEVIGIRPGDKDHAKSTLIFQGRHEQEVSMPVREAIQIRYTVCDQCSEPHRTKISAIRDSIKFEDVLKKLKAFYRSKG